MVNIIILIGLFLCRSGFLAFQNGPLVLVQNSEIRKALHIGFNFENHGTRKTSLDLPFQLCLKFAFELSQIFIPFDKTKREKGLFSLSLHKRVSFFRGRFEFCGKQKKEPAFFFCRLFQNYIFNFNSIPGLYENLHSNHIIAGIISNTINPNRCRFPAPPFRLRILPAVLPRRSRG